MSNIKLILFTDGIDMSPLKKVQFPSSYGLGMKVFWRYFHKGVCRTAPATYYTGSVKNCQNSDFSIPSSLTNDWRNLEGTIFAELSVCRSLDWLQHWTVANATLAFEDAQNIQSFSTERIDVTDYLYDTDGSHERDDRDDRGDINDTVDTNDADYTDDTK